MKWIIGIDEAGRGPLAGPVAVGVFAVEKRVMSKLARNNGILSLVKDSKQCSERMREDLYEKLKVCCQNRYIKYAVGFSTARYIDKYGIVKAIQSAMMKALDTLELNPRNCEVFLDGSLIAPAFYKNQKTIIKGDALIPVISAASICAKVERDRVIKRLGKKYPVYSFEIHKGYGTILHRKLIKQHGLSTIHRKSFCAIV